MPRPSFQFYPADWRGNHKLRRVDFKYRGIWIEVMCLLHDSDEYGILRWSLDEVSSAVPCHVNQLQHLIDKGILKGAPSGKSSEAVTFVDKKRREHVVLPPQPGPIWFSSRMVIDEYRRQWAARSGRQGGNPALLPEGTENKELHHPPVKGGDNGRVKLDSSSSSSIPPVHDEPSILTVEVRNFLNGETALPLWNQNMQNQCEELVRAKGWPWVEKAVDGRIKDGDSDPIGSLFKRSKRAGRTQEWRPPTRKPLPSKVVIHGER